MLAVAWPYIPSSEWVKLLQYASANVQLIRDGEMNAQKFWGLI
jgi:hypothetical protein